MQPVRAREIQEHAREGRDNLAALAALAEIESLSVSEAVAIIEGLIKDA